MVDAAACLAHADHRVVVLTYHDDAARAFSETSRLRVEPIVLYPGVDPLPTPNLAPDEGKGDTTIFCLGRFDSRKHIGLAIQALAVLRTRLPLRDFARVRLVVAGGYDARLREQRAFLSGCRRVVYTPQDEHFGSVPVEAMAAGRPVVAVSAGGPVETVRDGETGFLCPPQPEAFAAALARLLGDGALPARAGRAGRAHLAAHFSWAAFGWQLEGLMRTLVEERCSPR